MTPREELAEIKDFIKNFFSPDILDHFAEHFQDIEEQLWRLEELEK